MLLYKRALEIIILMLQQQQTVDGSWIRCMLVANVAAGNSLVTKRKHFDPMWRPPPGINSVVGEVSLLIVVFAPFMGILF